MDQYAQAYDAINQVLGDEAPSSRDIAARHGARQAASQWLTQRAAETEADARRMGNIQVDEPELTPWLRRAFPALGEQDAADLTEQYNRERQRRLNMGRIRFHADRSRTDGARGVEGTVLSATPVVGTGVNFLSGLGARESLNRIRAGEGTDQDYRIAGMLVGDAERMQDRGAGRQIIDTVAGSIGFGGELMLGGPLAGAGRAAGARVAGTIGARTGATLGQIAPVVAMRGSAGTAERLVPSADPSQAAPTLGEAAYGGFVDAAIEAGSELAGGPAGRLAGRIPVVGRVFRALTPSQSGLLGRAGYHGIVGEYFEERLAELGHGITGVHRREDGSPDFGVLGHIYHGETEQAVRQSLIELGAFGTMGLMGGGGWGLAGRVMNRNLTNGPALLTMPQMDPNADLDAMQPGYTDRQGRVIPPQPLRDRYAAIQARVDGRNQAVMSDWLETAPVDTLQNWVGQFGITQDLVNQRREIDRLRSEATEHAQRGIAQQEYEAQMQQGLDRIQQEIRAQSQAILGNFRTGLRQIQDEIFGSQAETTADNAAVATPAPVVPSAPVAPSAPSPISEQAQQEAEAYYLRNLGYIPVANEEAAANLAARHPDWIRETVNGRIRFRPPSTAQTPAPAKPAGMRDNQDLEDLFSQPVETPAPAPQGNLRENDVLDDLFSSKEGEVIPSSGYQVPQRQQSPPASQTAQDIDRLTILGEFANVRTPEQAAAIIQKYGEENLRRQNIDVDFQLQIARLDPASVRNALQGLQQPVSSVPARPTGVQTSTGVQTPPEASQGPSQASQTVQNRDMQLLEEAFAKAFPGGRMTPRGELEAKVGGRTVYVGFDEARRVARLDFEADTPGVPSSVQTGSVDLMRSIKSFIGELKPTGLGLEYRAIDTNRKGYRRSRADIYAKMLTEAGFQQTGGPGVNNEALYVWTPIKERKVFEDREEKSSRYKQLLRKEVSPRTLREAVIHAGGISTQSVREQFGVKSKGERIKEGGGISLREVDIPNDLIRNDGQPLDTLSQTLAGEGWLGARQAAGEAVDDYTERLLHMLRTNPDVEQGGQVSDKTTETEYDRYLKAQEKGRKALKEYLDDLRSQGATEAELADAIENARRQGYATEGLTESLRSGEETGQRESEEENPEWEKDDGLLTAREAAAEVDFDVFDEATPEPAPSTARVTRPSSPWGSFDDAPSTAELNARRVRDYAGTEPAQEATPVPAEPAPTADLVIQTAAKMIDRGVSEKKESQLRSELTPEQNIALDEELARLLNARKARVRGAVARGEESEYDASRMEERKPKGRGRRMRPGDYASSAVGALPSNAAQGEPISQYRLIANMSERFDVPWYVHNLSRQAAAVYAMRPRAILVNNMSAGNAPVFMHEVAHDIDQKQKLFPDVNAVRALPVAVQRGLQSWDYDPSNHDETTSAAEGFAEYLRMAVTGQLGNMTPEQQAAQAWINTRLQAVPGLWESLQETAADFRRFVGMTPTQQAAAGISASGEAERPELTNGQRLSEASGELWTSFRKAIENDQVALEAFENTATRLGKKWKIRPSEVMFQLRSAAPHYAAEMLQNGVFGFQFGPDGEIVRRVRLGQGLDDIIKGLERADLEEVYQGGVSRFETYFLARHIMAEEAEGRPSVGEASLEYYRRALNEMKQDAGFIARAEPAAQRFTQAFNATLDARAVAGIITQAQAETLKDRRPTYAPLDRVPEASNWKRLWRKFTGRKESLDSGIRTRSGSDLAILSPFKAYMARLNFLSMLMSRQAERLSLIGTVKTPGMSDVKLQGMGDFLVEVPQPVVPHRTILTPEQIGELLVKMGLEQDVVSDMIHEDLTPAELLYFTKSPIPINGKPHLVVLEQGQPHFYRIGNQDLYDLFVGERTLPEVAPLKIFRMATKAIKFGATSANPIFQVYNITRDSMTFARNTIDIGSVKDLPFALGRAYVYMARLGMGATREQLAAFDPAMTLYLSHAGEWTQQVNFDAKGIDQRYRDIVGRHGITKIMDFGRDSAQSIVRLIGAAEHAPRVVEMRNYLRQQGFTDAEIERAAKGEADAIPEWQVQRAMVAAAEVTTPFNRLGYLSRFLNLYIPFFGPSISGLSKGIRQAVNNPTRVAGVTALAMAVEILHWLANKDEPWYQELDDYQRNRWYVLRVGNTLIRFPKSREFEMIGASGLQQFLRMQSDSNPRFGGWLRDTIDQFTPPLWPSGLGTAWQLATNKDWRGNPIIPRADLDLPWQENFGRRAQYAFEQMTGGLTNRGRVQVPGVVNSPPSQSMQDFYDQYSDLSSQRLAYGRANRIGDQADYSGFPQEQEFSRLDTYNGLMRNFSRARSATSGDTRRSIEQSRVDITAALMGRRGAQMPSLASIPQEVRQETEEWLGGVLRTATAPRDPDTTRQRGESQEAFRERSRRADAQRERQRETARSIVQEWRLPPAEQERLLREALRRQGMGGEAIMRRVGRLSSRETARP